MCSKPSKFILLPWNQKRLGQYCFKIINYEKKRITLEYEGFDAYRIKIAYDDGGVITQLVDLEIEDSLFERPLKKE